MDFKRDRNAFPWSTICKKRGHGTVSARGAMGDLCHREMTESSTPVSQGHLSASQRQYVVLPRDNTLTPFYQLKCLNKNPTITKAIYVLLLWIVFFGQSGRVRGVTT